MIILVDQDGVLANFEKGHATKARAAGLAEHVVAEMRDYWQLLDGLTKEEIDAVMDLWYAPGFFKELEPIFGAREALHKLQELGHHIFICSTPMRNHPTCAQEKEAWIKEHLGRNFSGKLILTHDKTLIHGDNLIDDKPHIEGCRTPMWEHIIYDQRYNQGVQNKRRLHWGNWSQILP